MGPVITLLCGGLLAQGDTAICSAPADEILCLDGEISKHCKEKHSRALLKRYQPILDLLSGTLQSNYNRWGSVTVELSGGVCIPIHHHINSRLFVLYLYVLLIEIKANLTELVLY